MPVGMYGRLPPIPDRPAALYANIRPTGGPPFPVPAYGDYLVRIASDLKMLGNNQYGDCVAVKIANMIFLVTGTYPTLDAVLEFYRSQNPGFPQQDDGMVIQLAYEYLRNVGMRMPDGSYKKCIFFAKVDVNLPAEVEEALQLFQALGAGITVTYRNESQFDSGQPWTYQTGDQEAGGHGVLVAGWGQPRRRNFATWGEEAEWAASFDISQVDELWIVLFSEHLDGTLPLPEGVTRSAIASEFQRITGRPFPVQPEPGPKPDPPKPPDPFTGVDKALAVALREVLDNRKAPKYLRTAAQNWLTTHGY